MKKMPTLFVREFDEHNVVSIRNEYNGYLDWVLDSCVPTVKIDGSCCMVKDGELYIRYDAKKGKTPPEGAIPCCPPDPVTGHWPHWLKVEPNTPNSKWQLVAFREYCIENEPKDGTYEAVGLHFQGNPYGLTYDTLIKHGSIILDKPWPNDFESCEKTLARLPIEGIVWWDANGPICKLKRSDFGLDWPCEPYITANYMRKISNNFSPR